MRRVLLFFALIAIYCIACPFTKVEESFNLQAVHDVMHGIPLADYDHIDFPGVVPRTFVGATVLGLLSRLIRPFFVDEWISTREQIIPRLILGAMVSVGIGYLEKSVRLWLGKRTATIFMILLFCQFHILFWSSRTLPNTLALPLVLLGLSHWILSMTTRANRTTELTRMIRYLTFVGLVFRFEVGILLAIILVFEWAVYRHINLKTIVTQGCLTALVSLGLSIPIDSYFWQRWVWPEGSVFFFNAILNKSSEWGTMPFHSYFTIFLPRILMISYPLALVGFVADRRLRNLLGPALIYTAVFSILPHKEWRFIMYTIPIYTIAAASVVTKLSLKARHSRYATIGLVGVAGGMLACFCGSIMMLLISMHNYPGGEALATLNNMPLESASIHLDVLTAMTGASRFGQTRPLWSYHKNESHHSVDDYLEVEYTHFISDTPLNNTPFEIISVTYGLEKVKRKSPRIYLQNLMTIFGKDWTWETFLPVEIELKPKLYTFQLPDPQKVWVDYNIQHSSVLIYSKSYCPYCKRAKEILNKYCPHQYQVVELDLRKDGRELQAALIERTGRRTVPAIFMNGKIIGGSDDLAALDNQGVLGSQLPCNPHYSKGY